MYYSPSIKFIVIVLIKSPCKIHYEWSSVLAPCYCSHFEYQCQIKQSLADYVESVLL